MREALGIMHQDGGFPFQFSLNVNNNPKKPIPAVDFYEKINKYKQVGDVLNKELKIFVTPTEYFTTKFRQIFTKTQIKFTTAKKKVAWWSQHELLATAAKLCSVVRNTRLWNIPRYAVLLRHPN